MRSKRLEIRRSKIARAKTHEIDLDDIQQDFKVTVTVVEARKLVWPKPQSACSYVIVTLAKESHRTARRNADDPYYGESFVFEIQCTPRELQRSRLGLAVMDARCHPRLIGEACIDLSTVWTEPQHTVSHKWAQLSLPKDPAAGPTGYLKVDICILCNDRNEHDAIVPYEEKIENNLLLPPGSEQQRACYQVTVYAAYSLPSSAQNHTDRNSKPPNTFVRISFSGLVGKTSVVSRSHNPEYAEQVSMVERFPNMCQTIRIEVCSADGVTRVLAGTHLTLTEISHCVENGFLPTFGPSLLHMYGSWCCGAPAGVDGPYHRGSLLVALRAAVPYSKRGLRTVTVQPVPPLSLETLCTYEDFSVYCSIFEVSMLDYTNSARSCGVAITMAEVPAEARGDDEFTDLVKSIRHHKLHYTGSMDIYKSSPQFGYLEFANEFPVLQLAARLPDFRFRMYRNNMVYRIVSDLERELHTVEANLRNLAIHPTELMCQLKSVHVDVSAKILKFLDITCHAMCEDRGATELDRKQTRLQKEEIEKIYHRLSKNAKASTNVNLLRGKPDCSKKEVKLLLAQYRIVLQDLNNLIFKTPNGWPDIVLWLLANGSRVAYAKIAPSDVSFSVITEQRGRKYGRIQSVYLKPIKCLKHLTEPCCDCIAGKVELLCWMGPCRQRGSFEDSLPAGFKLKTNEACLFIKCAPLVAECYVNVCRAKLFMEDDNMTVSPAVRVIFVNAVKETQAKRNCSSPIWNEMVKIYQSLYSTPERLLKNPPEVLVEVYDTDVTNRKEYLGRVHIVPVVDGREDCPPALQWFDLCKDSEQTGRILMSAQLIQKPELLMKTTHYYPAEISTYGPGEEVVHSKPEPLPECLIPVPSTYKVDVYWWGLRDVSIAQKPCVVLQLEDVCIKSCILNTTTNCCNFTHGKTSQVIEGDFRESLCSPLTVKLYDSSTFGRTVFVGFRTVRNTLKYVLTWIPKHEREESLYSNSIISPDFFQINQMMFIKTGNDSDCDETSTSSKKLLNVKRGRWKRLFRRKLDEERCSLLPMYNKKKDQVEAKTTVEEDWWTRYAASLRNSHNEHENRDGCFVIYGSELESQPEFSKFKDWCITLKIYNGKKTGIPDKDDQLKCGYLKNSHNEHENRDGCFVIYGSELESQPEFSKFKDWCITLKIYNGKKTGIPDKDDQLKCGYLKVGLAIYKWPPPENTVAVSANGVDLRKGYFAEHPDNDPARLLVRVYLIKAELEPKFAGKSAPYATVQCGKKVLEAKNSPAPWTRNPVFGKMCEFRCCLPEDYQLQVSLIDRDSAPPEDLIGSTTIDLEDRVYTKHRACVGLANEYHSSGSTKWRDSQKPSVILEELCHKNHLPPPLYPDSSSVLINGVEYRDFEHVGKRRSTSERKERICLKLLHNWHTLPICGHYLVPEHVETRTLYKLGKPMEKQGEIQLWVDIFRMDYGHFIPPPVDISPRQMEEYELRVVVWDVQGVRLKGGKASDIYVKAWIGPSDEAQDTDIHYHSLEGEGRFNWRMVFHFLYQHSEGKLVLHEKGPFTEVVEHFPPILVVQVQDSEAASPEEFLGTLMLDLTCMPRGAREPKLCTQETLGRRKFSLFSGRVVRAWWPLQMLDRNTGQYYAGGMIDLELTLLPIEKALLMPVGLGRDPPAALPKPTRESFRGIWKSKPRWSGLLGTSSLVILSAVLVWFVLVPHLIDVKQSAAETLVSVTL